MTAVGKILAIINLLFSLAVGALVIMVFITRTHWVDEFKKLEGRYQIALASEQTYKTENEKVLKDRDAQVAQAKDQVKKLQADLAQQVEANNKLRDDLLAQGKKSTKTDASAQAGVAEIAKRQASEEKLRQTLKDADVANNKLVLENNSLRDRAVQAEIQMRAAVDRAQRMEGQMQELTKELVRVRAGGGGVARVGNRNPPPDNVEGLIKTTDPRSNLVTLTIGSDAGLSRGHTLEVFRLSSVPDQSKYLGTIRIVEVTATQAVGQPVGRLTPPPQPGDRVASHILGGG
jgi:regulator of replication initiation timing